MSVTFDTTQAPAAVQATWIASSTLASTRRFVVHQGGTRSGKTYNLTVSLAVAWETKRNWLFSVVRKTGPALRATVQRDVIEVLDRLGLYDPALHNKSENLIRNPRSGSVIEFFSADEPQKVRGRKRHVLWPNEANELTPEDFRQLNLRTTEQVWLDFNPSAPPDHWLWKLRDERPDECDWFISTYCDNPFLSAETIREIEALRTSDPYAWQVFGLGLPGASPMAVYPSPGTALPILADEPSSIGIDWGWNDPTVVVRTVRRLGAHGEEIVAAGLLYETHLTTEDVIARLPQVGVSKADPIYCDNEGDRVEALRRAGHNAHAASKGPGSVVEGIRWLRGHALAVAPGPASARLRDDLLGYQWLPRPDETASETPGHTHSHGPDAVRYSAEKWRSALNVNLTHLIL